MDVLLKLDTVVMEDESTEHNETSEAIRKRVAMARERQYARYESEWTNATVSNEKLMSYSQLNQEQQRMMQQWTSKHNWSTRVQMKILRLARTISDLREDENITNEAVWEAVTMRRSQVGRNSKGMVR